MKITAIIYEQIAKLNFGVIFTANDISINSTSRVALTKELNRMVREGKIAKSSKGKFYKPEISIFGELKPDFSELIKDFLFKDNKPIGYISGYCALNSLGLTTQVPIKIKIYTQTPKKPIIRSNYHISFGLQKNIITEDNIRLLVILDSLNLVNQIPDGLPENIYARFKSILTGLDSCDIAEIVKLAINYRPRTRAILGALLQELNKIDHLHAIKQTLNPSSHYKVRFLAQRVRFAKDWKLV